jgi:hypothetical protein
VRFINNLRELGESEERRSEDLEKKEAHHCKGVHELVCGNTLC